MTEENDTEFVMEKPLFTSVKLDLSMLVHCYNTQKIDLGFFFFPPEIEMDFFILKILLYLLFCAFSAESAELQD